MKTKALISCAVTAQLICVFDFAYAKVTRLKYSKVTPSFPSNEFGAPIAQLVEHRTLDRKVVGSNLTRGAVLCP